MTRDIFYTGIDIGSSKVCAIISRVGPSGELKIIGSGLSQAQGVQKGRIVDTTEAQKSVQSALDMAHESLGSHVPWTYVSISGNHVTNLRTSGLVHPSTLDKQVSADDVARLTRNSYPEIPPDKEVIHVTPVSYLADNDYSVRDPIGMYADQLQVESHVVLGDRSAVNDTIKVVEDCGIPVKGLVLSPIASAEAVLTQDEKELGVVLADVGAGSTDIVVFERGSLLYNTFIPVGGSHLTRDLSIAYRIPFYSAEDLKQKWGHALPESLERDEEVLLPGFQGQQSRLKRRSVLCQPLVDRLQETLALIMIKVQEAGLRRFPRGGLVLTGGSAEMPGIASMAQQIFGCAVRVGRPQPVQGLSIEQQRPSFATAIGLLMWGIRHYGEERNYRKTEKINSSARAHKPLFHRIKDAIAA